MAIVNYDMGNIKSVANAFELFGETVEVTDNPQKLAEAEAIILPGVGSFSDGMNNLKKKNLDSCRPFLSR
ncbi:MAG: hypothetical protein IH831_06375 [Planctomycetes bacterium]|nr:hypothetical protein [Planctomycetota bacterium]